MATTMFSMISSVAQTVNVLIEKNKQLENTVMTLANSNSPLISERSMNVSSSDTMEKLEKRVDMIESQLLKIGSHDTTIDASNFKQLSDELRLVKGSLTDMSKERVLLETALTHKLEQHISRMFKERVESALKEQQRENREYVDQNIAEVKSLLNNVVSLIAAQQQAIVSNETKSSNEHASDLIDIDALKQSSSSSAVDDFDIEIQQATSGPKQGASKRVMRKK